MKVEEMEWEEEEAVGGVGEIEVGWQIFKSEPA